MDNTILQGLHNVINRYVDLLLDCGRVNNDVNKLIAALEWGKMDNLLYDILMGKEEKAFKKMNKECEKLEEELRYAAHESQPESAN